MRRAAILLALVACAKSVDELSPFPCAVDGSCPAGLACVDGSCAAPALDALCTTGDDPTDCSTAAPGAICAAKGGAVGACEIPCAPGCSSGRACSSTLPGAVCLIDCTGGGACPGGTTCRSRNFDSVMVCAPQGIEIAECQMVISPVVCNMCGQPSIDDVMCPDGGSTCPHGSTCSADSTSCTCGAGTKAVDCSNNPCNGQCSGSSWWCAPDVPSLSCESDRFALSGTCHCYDGRNLNFSCNAAMTCEAACEQ